MSEWVSVEDGLPGMQVRVLVSNKEGFMRVTHRDVVGWSCPEEITHWMPLPSVPRETGE
jgi:hypothetical protein